jgi:hypothetical protein
MMLSIPSIKDDKEVSSEIDSLFKKNDPTH